MDNLADTFRSALADAGVVLHASEPIIPDGLLHRCRSADDRPGKRSVWYRLHPDTPPSGAGGDWRTGASITWTSRRQSTDTERQRLRERIDAERAQRQTELDRQRRECAERAQAFWKRAEPASASHPYLRRKQIPAGIARQIGDLLALPVTDLDGRLWGLQTIAADGTKRFSRGMGKAGHFIAVNGMPESGRRLLICEGWATATSLAGISPADIVLAALDAGNLLPVAMEVRKRFPAMDMVIAADADPVGMEKARKAAIASHARLIWPRFPSDAPAGLNDFNDWLVWRRSQREVASAG